MKRIMKLLITITVLIGMATGCGTDPVASELLDFLNYDMTEVNANYEELKIEMDKWSTFEDDAELAASIKDYILPNIDESLGLLLKIELQTDEIKVIKEKYKLVLYTYREGFVMIMNAAEAGDNEAAEAGGEKVAEGIKLLDEYNRALEELANEKNMEVEY